MDFLDEDFLDVDFLDEDFLDEDFLDEDTWTSRLPLQSSSSSFPAHHEGNTAGWEQHLVKFAKWKMKN